MLEQIGWGSTQAQFSKLDIQSQSSWIQSLNPKQHNLSLTGRCCLVYGIGVGVELELEFLLNSGYNEIRIAFRKWNSNSGYNPMNFGFQYKSLSINSLWVNDDLKFQIHIRTENERSFKFIILLYLFIFYIFPYSVFLFHYIYLSLFFLSLLSLPLLFSLLSLSLFNFFFYLLFLLSYRVFFFSRKCLYLYNETMVINIFTNM